MSWNFQRVAGPYGFTEGPVWDGNRVLFSDIPTSRVLAYDVESGETSVAYEQTNYANGLKYGPDGVLYACEVGARRVARYESDEVRPSVVESYGETKLNSPNDLAFDADGRLWFTDPRYAENAAGLGSETDLDHESVYRVDPGEGGEWQIERVTTDTTKPNGILVSPDQSTLYVAQSDPDPGEQSELRAYPIRGDGTLGEYRPLFEFTRKRAIDGMCLDADGDIIAAVFATRSDVEPAVYVFSPTGDVRQRHPVPGEEVTNCAFGGDDLRDLYVTGNGSLYRARTDRTGLLGPP